MNTPTTITTIFDLRGSTGCRVTLGDEDGRYVPGDIVRQGESILLDGRAAWFIGIGKSSVFLDWDGEEVAGSCREFNEQYPEAKG